MTSTESNQDTTVAGNSLSIFNCKWSDSALALVLAVFATACNIVSTPGSFESPLYVANSGGNSILIYAAFSNGNSPPTNSMAGGNTGLSSPSGVVVNAAGAIYVANSGADSLTIYPLASTGNVTPQRTISGTSTQLDNPQGVALDAAGNLYVANADMTTSSITVTALASPHGIGFDATGRLYVANKTTPSITVYAPGATGDVIPIRMMSGDNTQLNQPLFIALRPP